MPKWTTPNHDHDGHDHDHDHDHDHEELTEEEQAQAEADVARMGEALAALDDDVAARRPRRT